MRKKEKAYSIALASTFIILILVSSTESASDDNVLSDEFSKEGNNIAAYTVDETRITISGSASNPDIYAGKIVWEDTRNGVSNIYIYDLPTKKETQITKYDENHNPVIYDNKIVYSWQSNIGDGVSSISMYDLSTNDTIGIGPWAPPGVVMQSAIYGNIIVWGLGYIWMHDLSIDRQTQISCNESADNPAIYDNKIVWQGEFWTDNDIYVNDIFMYDISTQKETQITTNASCQANPAIYGDRIVWQDNRNENWDIYMYNVSTKKETQITSSPDDQTSPKIYGNRILWQDVGGEDDGWEYHGIYMYDLSTKQKMKITSGGYGSDYAIYDNRIVWTDNCNGGSDIYMGTLITSPPVAAFSASPTSGKAPLNVTFTDKSKNYPTSWKWNFGDGTNSTEQNPTHRYRAAGNYTVKLTATNALGSNTTTKTNYIKVTPTNTRQGPYSSK